MKRKRLFLIDGHSFIFRAYYAMPPLTNSAGENTGAIYGFWAMVKKILEKEKPDAVAVCFDTGKPTFRHEKYKEYKANRPEAPDELIEQFGAIRELVEAHNIPVYSKEGFEADDLLGTLAKKAEKDGFEVFIATSDKDAMQLVNKNIKIYHAHKDGAIVDEAKVKEKFSGLGPDNVIDIMGLMGDSSDNVPGVPSVGEKTAVKLLQEHGSIKGIYENLDKITRTKLKQNLEENREMADLSRELVTIDCNVPIKYAAKDLMVHKPDEKETQTLFERFEFRAFIKSDNTKQKAAVDTKQKRDYNLVFELEELKELAKTLHIKKLISLDTETTSIDSFQAELVGVSVSFKKGEAYFIPIKHESGHVVSLANFKKIIGPILSDPKIKKCGQNIKYDCHVLARHDLRVEGVSFDTMIASYLINPAKLNHNLDDISREYLGIEKIKTDELIGSGRGQITMDQVPLGKLTEYAGEDADCVFQLVPLLEKVLREKKLDKLFTDLEMPLLSVLEEIEENGVTIDQSFLSKLSKKAEKDLGSLSKEIEKLAGESFNINSTKQLQEILFTKLKLPVIKKTKTGISTDVSVLEKLAEDYEIAEHLLQYRERQKLKSTYMDALPELVNPNDQLIHTSFNQTITATGRLSSSNPNLQNIPIKSELGREIRKGFIPREKSSQLLSADYSQIELRILAHLSGDPVLSKAFQEDLDIHNYTATLLYDVKDKDITREMRYAAKTINFSIIYGKTAFGLSKDLHISVPEAAEFIEAYFKRYKRIKDYLESQKEKAHKHGFLTTMLGRRSYFPDINSSNGMRRQFAERAAINAPIQGSAADLIKQAMLDVSSELKKVGLKSLMIMQVHDELVFDVPKGEADLMKKLVASKMEGAMKLKVPLKVSVSLGDNWFKGE